MVVAGGEPVEAEPVVLFCLFLQGVHHQAADAAAAVIGRYPEIFEIGDIAQREGVWMDDEVGQSDDGLVIIILVMIQGQPCLHRVAGVKDALPQAINHVVRHVGCAELDDVLPPEAFPSGAVAGFGMLDIDHGGALVSCLGRTGTGTVSLKVNQGWCF